MEARRHLGDEVVLLESIPPDGDSPARITVMTDATKLPAGGSTASTAVGVQAKTATSGRKGYGYHAQKTNGTVTVAQEESAPGAERISSKNGASNGSGGTGDYDVDVDRRRVRDLIDDVPTYPEPRRRSVAAPGRGQLFPRSGDTATQGSTLPAAGLDNVEQLLRSQLELLHNRLDKIERQFGGAIIGAAQAWASSPLFSSLINLGFRPGTVTKFFDALASKGYQPDTDAETLKWALAQEVRRAIGLCAIREAHGAQVFIGPSGAGKTSLLLKLAKHSGFYGHRRAAVIAVEPEDADRDFHVSPVELFRRHGLPVQSVRTVEEMQKAVLRVQHFDHILIDTPALPLHPNAARKALRHVKRLVDPILPLRVQLVINATRSLEGFDPDTIRSLPLRPEALALTHMDETPGWGRIAEWLVALQMPVQFVSTSSSVPDGVISFSPSWFVEEMMKL